MDKSGAFSLTDLVERANAASENEDYNEAVLMLTKAIRRNGRNVALYIERSSALSNRNYMGDMYYGTSLTCLIIISSC